MSFFVTTRIQFISIQFGEKTLAEKSSRDAKASKSSNNFTPVLNDDDSALCSSLASPRKINWPKVLNQILHQADKDAK